EKQIYGFTVYCVTQGTDFALQIKFSAQLFKGSFQGNNLMNQIRKKEKYFFFSAEKTFVVVDDKVDFAGFKLKPNDQRSQKFGPLPGSGEACLIGHPGGSVKKIDPTCIIELEKREERLSWII
ncbi:hypothetical protein CCH79_00021139, partial [Gambusia affinis]